VIAAGRHTLKCTTQLASWVGDIIAGIMLTLGILLLGRRHHDKRSMPVRHFKGCGIERTRLDIDDRL
jgi:hypothetical protein